jgi:DNA repair exonuclease SbcCD ATPase subunit
LSLGGDEEAEANEAEVEAEEAAEEAEEAEEEAVEEEEEVSENEEEASEDEEEASEERSSTTAANQENNSPPARTEIQQALVTCTNCQPPASNAPGVFYAPIIETGGRREEDHEDEVRHVDIENLENQLDEMDLRIRQLQRALGEATEHSEDSDEDRQEQFNQYIENDQLLREQLNTLQASVQDLEETRYTYNEYHVTNLPQETYLNPDLGYVVPNDFEYRNSDQYCLAHIT